MIDVKLSSHIMFWGLGYMLPCGLRGLFLSEVMFMPDVVLWRCNRRNAIMTAAW